MLEINVSGLSQKFIESLPSKHARQIVSKIHALALHPTPPQSKQLEGLGRLRRLRSGDYRIVYFADSGTLYIVLIDKRNDDAIYRHLTQMFK